MGHRKIYPYNPNLVQLAKNLRNNSTKGEVLLWQYLKNKQIFGFDFHRQKPLLNYIVDFFCNELALAIEIDGGSHLHDAVAINDENRQKEIEELGISFLRFTEREVRTDAIGVVTSIENWVLEWQSSQKTHP